MMKTIRQIILVISCALVMVGFAPNSGVDETNDGLVTSGAIVATASSSLAASRVKVIPSTQTCYVNSPAERVVLSAAPTRAVSRAHLATRDHGLKLLRPLRC